MPTTPSPSTPEEAERSLRTLTILVRTVLSVLLLLLTTGMVNHGHDVWALAFFALAIAILFAPTSRESFRTERKT